MSTFCNIDCTAGLIRWNYSSISLIVTMVYCFLNKSIFLLPIPFHVPFFWEFYFNFYPEFNCSSIEWLKSWMIAVSSGSLYNLFIFSSFRLKLFCFLSCLFSSVTILITGQSHSHQNFCCLISFPFASSGQFCFSLFSLCSIHTNSDLDVCPTLKFWPG